MYKGEGRECQREVEKPCTMLYLPCLAYNHCFSGGYCMMNGLSCCAPHAVSPGSNSAASVNIAINDRPVHTAGCHLLSVV